jgi:hypothetical protein
MALIRLFKTPKHNRFQYNPRYYDPKQEELEERLRTARGEGANDTEAMKARISSGFRKRHSRQKVSGNTKFFSTNFLLIAIIIILFGLTYVVLTVYLPQIEKLLEGVN